MRMSRSDFLAWPHKAITLLGMSGVGKTTLAYKLPSSKWFHYSGDYRIGTKYLAEPILDNIKRQAMQVDFLRDLLRNDSIYIASNITFHNLQPVSTFLGKIGRTDMGGLPVAEFKRRQRLHRELRRGVGDDLSRLLELLRRVFGMRHERLRRGMPGDGRQRLHELRDRARLPPRVHGVQRSRLHAARHAQLAGDAEAALSAGEPGGLNRALATRERRR